MRRFLLLDLADGRVACRQRERNLLLIGILFVVLMLLRLPIAVLAHGGGTPRLTDISAGPYRLYAWTQPEPLRAGEIHVTVGVTSASATSAVTGGGDLVEPITDATVTLYFFSPDNDRDPIERVATLGGVAAVYYEADADLPTAGRWRFLIQVAGAAGSGEAEFIAELLPPRTVNWSLLGSAGALFVLLILLIGFWNRRRPST